MGVIGARRCVSVLSALLSAVVLGLLGVTAAWGAVTHKYLWQVTEVPASSGVAAPGPLSEVSLMAVDSGNLFVAENGHQDERGTIIPERLDELNASSGAAERQFALPSSSQTYFDYFGLAAGHATGQEQVYLGAEDSEFKDVVDVFDGEGHLLGSPWSGTPSGPFSPFAGIGGIAADGRSSGLGWSAGDVYVSDSSQKVVDVFKPTVGNVKGEYVTRIEGPEAGVPFGTPTRVAVNQSNGDVVVVDASTDVIDVFEPTALETYALVRRITGTLAGPFSFVPTALAVDTNGDIYVGEGGRGGSVYEFNEKGEEIGRLAGTPGGAFRFANSLAVDPETHEVYVGDGDGTGNTTEETGAVDAFGPDLVVPDVTTGSASKVRPTSAIVSGTVNPDDAGEAMCQFASGTSAELGVTTPCVSPIPNGEAPVPVERTLTGLAPDTTYVYRLQASNQNGLNPGEPYQDAEFHTLGPGVHEQWATNVTATSVTLNAEIDPNGAGTAYYFQYGTGTGYGTDIPVAPGASIGSANGDVTVNQQVQGLLPATVYHYRVVARSELPGGEVVEFAGADQSFTAQGASESFALPDGRAWELVSPPDKHGSGLEFSGPEGSTTQASVNGEAISYSANGPTEDEPPGNRAVEFTQLISKRSPAGWATKVITTPFSEVGGLRVGWGPEYRMFSTDLALAVLQPLGGTTLSAEASELTPYLRQDDTCEASPLTCYRPLVTSVNVSTGVKFGDTVNVVAATPDLSHVILESQQALTNEASLTEAENAVYEWGAGTLRLVATGATIGGGGGTDLRHAVSDDGSRIVFEQGEHLYQRNMTGDTTVQIDTVEAGARGGRGVPRFQAASGDGSTVFFTDASRLTIDSTALGSLELPDLYEFNANTDKLTDLTVDPNQGEHANVIGLLQGVSEDGTYVYFVADGALAPGAAQGHCQGEESPLNACNLYVRHDGVTTFIAALSYDDLFTADGRIEHLDLVSARISPDGRWFAFMSNRSLTGYDNRDANSGERDEEVFLYNTSESAGEKRLRCVSCNPTGARPVGMYENKALIGPLLDRLGRWHERWLAAAIPGWTRLNTGEASLYQSRYLSDGGRLFFNSVDALVPQDVNGTTDVYEFEPEGQGDCAPSSVRFNEAIGGCIALISSAGSAEESVFVDASESGDDAFFLTAAKLRPEDFDASLDLYDARVCTQASPCLPVPQASPPPCATGESCKPAPLPQPPIFGAPSSATFSGAGNVTAESRPVAAHKSLTRAQRLARALRACHRKHGKRERARCVRRARGRVAGGRAARGPRRITRWAPSTSGR
jgi:hypothetical protein